jgi:hypothetical protein
MLSELLATRRTLAPIGRRGTVAECLSERRFPLALTLAEHAPTVSEMSAILVVDDSKVMRDMIVACLRAIPATSFTHASTGLEAIERLSLAI